MSGGSCREGFDLFNRYGRDNFRRRICFRGQFWDLVWRDTFGRYICKIIGHTSKTFITDGTPPKKICYRCFREAGK